MQVGSEPDVDPELLFFPCFPQLIWVGLCQLVDILAHGTSWARGVHKGGL